MHGRALTVNAGTAGLPSRLLATVGGESVRRLVPEKMVMLKAEALEVTIHPSDVAVVGSKEAVARARAAVADRLTDTEAYLTTSKEAQEIEDELRALRGAPEAERALATLRDIDERLSSLVVPYEEWEVLYRQRLQVERDLLRAGHVTPAESRDGGADGGGSGVLDRVGRAVEELIR